MNSNYCISPFTMIVTLREIAASQYQTLEGEVQRW
jgi:hypothetical protein